MPSTHVQSSYVLFLYWNISVKASYTKLTHLIVVARVSMFMQDGRILQNFCCMPEAKWRLQHLEMKIMMDVYHKVLANTSSNYNSVFWVILTLSKSREIDC